MTLKGHMRQSCRWKRHKATPRHPRPLSGPGSLSLVEIQIQCYLSNEAKLSEPHPSCLAHLWAGDPSQEKAPGEPPACPFLWGTHHTSAQPLTPMAPAPHEREPSPVRLWQGQLDACFLHNGGQWPSSEIQKWIKEWTQQRNKHHALISLTPSVGTGRQHWEGLVGATSL